MPEWLNVECTKCSKYLGKLIVGNGDMIKKAGCPFGCEGETINLYP